MATFSGTSLFGGSGNILGTLLGGLFMGTLQDGMVLIGVSPFSQGVVSGIVILAAVIMGALQTRGCIIGVLEDIRAGSRQC